LEQYNRHPFPTAELTLSAAFGAENHASADSTIGILTAQLPNGTLAYRSI